MLAHAIQDTTIQLAQHALLATHSVQYAAPVNLANSALITLMESSILMDHAPVPKEDSSMAKVAPLATHSAHNAPV